MPLHWLCLSDVGLQMSSVGHACMPFATAVPRITSYASMWNVFTIRPMTMTCSCIEPCIVWQSSIIINAGELTTALFVSASRRVDYARFFFFSPCQNVSIFRWQIIAVNMETRERPSRTSCHSPKRQWHGTFFWDSPDAVRSNIFSIALQLIEKTVWYPRQGLFGLSDGDCNGILIPPNLLRIVRGRD